MNHVMTRRVVKELTRTAIAFSFLLLTASIMTAIQLYNDNVSILNDLHRLPSLHDASQPLHSSWWVKPWMADSTLYVMVGGGVAGLVVGVVWWQGRPIKAVQVVRRFLWILAVGYAARAVCLWGTVLPPSNPLCQYKQRTAREIIFEGVPQLLAGSTHTCSDKIFSGHTLVATLLAAFWWKLTVSRWWRAYAAVNWCAMVASSLAGRHHYTVDIVVGCLVATLLFHVYHLLLGVVIVCGDDDNFDSIDSNSYKRQPAVPVPIRRAIMFMDGLDLRDNDRQLLPSSRLVIPLTDNNNNDNNTYNINKLKLAT